jgi:glycosyltransferase involved in cell wall biosynthesis
MESKKVSVVIPCRNEEKNIRGCVESILSTNYTDIEVVVVDGMSDDGTREILSQLSAEYFNVRFVDNPHKLTPFAFNIGCKAATGFYVQIVGSRNTLDPDYIPLLVKALEEDPEIACVGGDYQHVYDTDFSRFITYAMESKFGVGSSNYRTKKESAFVDTVGIPMYRKSIFDEIGYFDERLTRNQDDDFNFRVTQKGHKIFYVFEAKTQYFVRGSLKKLFKQFSQYGYFKVFVNKKHKTVTTLRQLVPVIFLLFLILGLPLSIFISKFIYLYALGILLYLFVGAMSLMIFTKKPLEIIATQLSALVMHIGYGQGYLKGIYDFLILGREPSTKMQKQTT